MPFSKLHLQVGEQKVEVELNGLDKLHQIQTLKSVVNQFFEELERATLDEMKPAPEVKKEEIKMEQAAEALGVSEEDLTAWADEFKRAGINRVSGTNRIGSLVDRKKLTTRQNILKHQAYYICPDCRNKGKHFIPIGTPFVNCHECGKELTVSRAADGPFPTPDQYGNVFIAGSFMRADKYEEKFKSYTTLEDKEKQDAEEEKQYAFN